MLLYQMDERDSHKEQRKGRSTIESIFATRHNIERTFWTRKFNSLNKVKPLTSKPQLSRRSPVVHPPLPPSLIHSIQPPLFILKIRQTYHNELSIGAPIIARGWTSPGTMCKKDLFFCVRLVGGLIPFMSQHVLAEASTGAQHSRCSRFSEMRADPRAFGARALFQL